MLRIEFDEFLFVLSKSRSLLFKQTRDMILKAKLLLSTVIYLIA